MKQSLLLSFLVILLFTSCSTAYKLGQTPDDVYYSPGRAVPATQENQKQSEEYQQYTSSLDDNYLRMKVANRYRWDMLDDFTYWQDSRYDFGSYNYYYNTMNPYVGWTSGWGYNTWYPFYSWSWRSPVYTLVYYYKPAPKAGGYTAGANISAFRNKVYSNTNLGYKDPKTGNFVPTGSNNNFGNLLKRVFTPATASNPNAGSYDRAVRTYTPSTPSSTPSNSAPSSSAGGSSGGFKSTGSSTSTGRGGKG